jgi:AraC family transcriptional regulator of adaptative response / DNA-3-methyladenine glycosylase II
MLAFLAARAMPGVEAVAHGAYCRSMALNGVAGCFAISPDAVNNALVVHLQFGEPRSLFYIIERIRAMFDLNADWAAIIETLRSDPMLLGPAEANPGLRVPGCWNGFELTVRAILGQQMTLKGATALAGNLVRTFGQRFAGANGLTHLFPSPEVLADATLTGIGLPRTRADTIRALARAVCNGQLRYEGIVDSEAFLTRLREVPGVGEWTSQYVAMRALGEPDAIPSSDLALQRALGLANSHDFSKRAEAWRPWRAYAAMYLWEIGAGMSLEARRRTKSAAVQESTSRHHAAASG